MTGAGLRHCGAVDGARSTFATWSTSHDRSSPAARSVVAAKCWSRVLANTSVTTTANFYGHVQPAMLKWSANRLAKLMREVSGTRPEGTHVVAADKKPPPGNARRGLPTFRSW